jgi:hypothetical protein
MSAGGVNRIVAPQRVKPPFQLRRCTLILKRYRPLSFFSVPCTNNRTSLEVICDHRHAPNPKRAGDKPRYRR